MVCRISAGFTLAELLIVVFLTGLLASFALPASVDLFESSQRRALNHEVMSLFAETRHLAIRQGSVVTLCPLDAANRCSSDWSMPLVLFVDANNTRSWDNGEPVIRRFNKLDEGKLTLVSTSNRYLRYSPLGRLHGSLGGRVTWCPDSKDASKAAQWVLAYSGRVRKAQDTDNTGVVNSTNGADVVCS